jgi:hypothetical protein
MSKSVIIAIRKKLIAEVGLESNYYAFSNSCGETESPEKFAPLLYPALQDQSIAVIADNDPTGERAAQIWAEHFAEYPADARIVRIPSDKGKDLRDFVRNGGEFQDILQLFNEATPVKPLGGSKTEKKNDKKLELTRVRLLDRFCRKLKPLNFTTDGKDISQMDYTVQSVDELIRIAKARRLDLTQKDGAFHIYNEQFWERIQSASFHIFLRNAAMQFGVPKNLARYCKFQEKVRDQFQGIANFPFVKDDGVIRINLQSGTLEFRDGQDPVMVPFDKRHGLCYQLGYDYDPNADCPMYREFMDRCVPDPANQMILEEYAAYVFVRKFNFERILFLYGTGANGKSVFIAILKALFGKPNVADYRQGYCIDTAINIESRHGGGFALTAKIENKTPAGIVPVD